MGAPHRGIEDFPKGSLFAEFVSADPLIKSPHDSVKIGLFPDIRFFNVEVLKDYVVTSLLDFGKFGLKVKRILWLRLAVYVDGVNTCLLEKDRDGQDELVDRSINENIAILGFRISRNKPFDRACKWNIETPTCTMPDEILEVLEKRYAFPAREVSEW